MTANTIHVVLKLKDGLCQLVEVTDLGELHWVFGMEIQCDRIGHTIHISQCAYTDTILYRFNLTDLKPLSKPRDIQVLLTSEQSLKGAAEFAVMHNVPYCEAVSILTWAALVMCPDIAFTVATVTCFPANPGLAHWEAVKHIFHYLAGLWDL